MKKMMLGMIAGLMMTTSASFGESIWFKEVANRYDYVKYATWLMTQLKIDFGVWPVAPGHGAGAVYTDDGWESVNWQTAQWEANVQGPFGGWDEAWTVYITGQGENGQYMGQSMTPFTIEFALYVTDQYGNWTWDSNGGQNYSYYVD